MLRRLFRRVNNSLSQISFLPPPPNHLPTTTQTATPYPLNEPTPIHPLHLLSTEPLIVVAPFFLDPKACPTIIETAQAVGRRWSSVDTDHDVKYELAAHPAGNAPAAAAAAAHVLEDVYQRIDHLIGCARTSQDVNPKVHHYGSSEAVAKPPPAATARRLPSGLHVDTNARSARYVTAILYLTTLSPEADGATVFPAATVRDSPTQYDCVVQAAASALVLNENILHTNHAALEDSACRKHADVLVQAGELCGGVVKGESGGVGLSVVPEVGKLVVFFTCNDEGEVDPCSLHGAARVGGVEGEDKWTLQIFKDVPVGVNRRSFIQDKRKRVEGFCK